MKLNLSYGGHASFLSAAMQKGFPSSDTKIGTRIEMCENEARAHATIQMDLKSVQQTDFPLSKDVPSMETKLKLTMLLISYLFVIF